MLKKRDSIQQRQSSLFTRFPIYKTIKSFLNFHSCTLSLPIKRKLEYFLCKQTQQTPGLEDRTKKRGSKTWLELGRTSNRKRNLSGNLEPNPNPNPTSLPSNDPLPENNEIARSEFNKIVSRAHWCKARGAVRTNVRCRGSSRRRCVVGDRRQKLRGSISI